MASRGDRQASFEKTTSSVRGFLSAGGHTRRHTLFEYSLEIPLKASKGIVPGSTGQYSKDGQLNNHYCSAAPTICVAGLLPFVVIIG